VSEDDFTDLFGAHYAAVLAYGLRRVDSATAHDLAAEVFVVAWRRLPTAPERPRAWLLAVARRVLANELRRQERAGRLHRRIADQPATAAQDGVVEGWAGDDELGRAVARLSTVDQELVRLLVWEELDPQEAAEVLGCTGGAFRVRLHRVRKRLAEHWGEAPTAHAVTTTRGELA